MTPSASILWLLDDCQWWARDEVPQMSREPSPYMALGTAVHAAIECALRGTGPVLDETTALLWGVDLGELSEAFGQWQEWFGDDNDLSSWTPELAVAWHPRTDTARVLSPDGHRKYDLEPGEIPGTMDAVHFDGVRATICDWKIGDDWQGYTPAIAENKQLWSYGLATARLYKLDEIDVATVKITSDGVFVDRHTLDMFDLDAMAARTRDRLAAVRTSRPQPGEHCGRCPVAATCPASTAAAQSLALSTTPGLVSITTPGEAGALHARLAVVEAAVNQAKTMLSQWGADDGEIEMSDGKRLRLVEQTRKSITLDGQEGDEAQAILSEFDVASAIELPSPSVTWARIEAALKEQGHKVAPMKREIESRLIAAGAIRTAPHGSRWLAVKGQ